MEGRRSGRFTASRRAEEGGAREVRVRSVERVVAVVRRSRRVFGWDGEGVDDVSDIERVVVVVVVGLGKCHDLWATRGVVKDDTLLEKTHKRMVK